MCSKKPTKSGCGSPCVARRDRWSRTRWAIGVNRRVNVCEIIIYPASSEHWIRWQQNAEFLLLFLDPALITQTADELAARSTIELIESQKVTHDPLLQQIGLALKAEIDEGTNAFSSLYAESLASALSAHLLRRYTVWKPTIRDSIGHHAAPALRPVITLQLSYEG